MHQRNSSGRKSYTAAKLALQGRQLLPEESVSRGLLVNVLPQLRVERRQQLAIVGRLVQNVQLGSLLGVGQLRHHCLQLVEVLSEVNASLPLHRVVKVANLSALLLLVVWRAPGAAAAAAVVAATR